MPSKKKLEDLEYNVFKKDSGEDTDNNFWGSGSGCVPVLGGVILTIILIVVMVSFMQVGKVGPSSYCAVSGCSNKPRPGSRYCWLHSASNNAGGISTNPTESKSSKDKEKDKENEDKSSGKIWGGDMRRSEEPQTGSLIN